MKRVLFFVVALVLLSGSAALAETKIGVFYMKALMVNSDYGKEVAAQLKAKFEPMAKELEREAESIKQLESELKNQNLALKLEARQDKQREYRRKTRNYQDSVVAFQQKRQAEEQKLGQPIVQRVVEVMTKYAKANGYTVVFEMGTGGVSYVAEGVDITNALIDELNKLKKAGK